MFAARTRSLRIRSLAPACLALSIALTAAALAQTMRLPVPVGLGGDPAAQTVLDGNAAFLRGDLRAATRDYRAALARKPGFAVATFNLGLVEMHEGRSAQGLQHMDRGIALAQQHGMGASDIERLRALRAAFDSRAHLSDA